MESFRPTTKGGDFEIANNMEETDLSLDFFQ